MGDIVQGREHLNKMEDGKEYRLDAQLGRINR